MVLSQPQRMGQRKGETPGDVTDIKEVKSRESTATTLYHSPYVRVTWHEDQILRVLHVIWITELTFVSINYVRSHIIREALRFYVTSKLALVIVVYKHADDHVTNKGFIDEGKLVPNLSTDICKWIGKTPLRHE